MIATAVDAGASQAGFTTRSSRSAPSEPRTKKGRLLAEPPQFFGNLTIKT